MATRKRPGPESDDEEVAVESASSNLRNNTNKRARIAHATYRAADIDDDANHATDAQMDDSSEASEDEDGLDRDTLQASQYVKRQYQQHKENREEPKGIIEEVRCENFMCHEKLTVKLGPLINFIIGHNGSGKSAVLTALTVCLGSKATTTNRGSSLKSMIKEGKDTATLSVKIKNQGEDAYKPDLYGKSIIVERHFSLSGKSGFRLKNAQGKLVSKTKRDLDDIIDFFALQLDNPINVLNQDMARQFLSGSSPSDKYKFFLRGTQLETLDSDYKLLEETLENLEGRLEGRVDDIKLLESASIEAESRKKRMEVSDTIRQEIKKTQRMHAWAQVEEQEQLLQQHNVKVGNAELRVQEAETAAAKASEAFEEAEQSLARAQRDVAELHSNLEPAEAAYKEVQAQFDEGRGKLLNLQADSRHAKDALKSERAKRLKLENEIQAEQDLLEAENGGGHTRRAEQLRDLKEAHETAQADSITHAQALPELEDAVRNALERVQAAQEAFSNQRAQVDREQGILRKLEQDQGKRFAGYKQRNMERLVQMVDREQGWKSKPIGPLGLHIKIKESKWTGLIEKHIGATLDSFVVTSQDDKTRLLDVMKRADCNTSILIGNAAAMNTARHEPEGNVTTILRVLEIESQLVRNQLIINSAIEQTVLFNNLDQANAYVNRTRPQHVKAVLAWTNSGNNDGVKLDWSRSGNKRSGPIQPLRGMSRMQANSEDQIAQQQRAIYDAKQALHRSEQERRQMQANHEKARQDVVKHKRERDSKIMRAQQLSDDIDGLQEEIDKNRPHHGRLQELERQLDEATANETAQANITKELIMQKAQIDVDQQQLLAQCEAAREEMQNQRHVIDAANFECSKYGERRTKALREKNVAFQAIADRKEELQDQIRFRDAQERNLNEQFVAEALKVCPRVPVDAGMTPAKLDDKLERYNQEIARAEREAGGTLEELTNAWKKAKTTWFDAKREYKAMEELCNTLIRSLSQRKQRWHTFRRYITARARGTFIYLFAERQFRGRILLDHTKKLLDLSVEPDITQESDTGRQASTLSGGEKSFSTVCLLLSIWEAMGSPIRCLDEFDVFMDSVNRSISMRLMINAARRAVGRQFILITPQSMQTVDVDTDISVFKMPDPERGQQALPYSATD